MVRDRDRERDGGLRNPRREEARSETVAGADVDNEEAREARDETLPADRAGWEALDDDQARHGEGRTPSR